MWAAGGIFVVGLVAVSIFMFPHPAPVAPVRLGTLMIDGVPWAVVSSVVAEDGTSTTLPPDASTPISLQLPAGTYRVTLTGPPPEHASREVRVSVEDGRTVTVGDVRFTSFTADAYFEQYLSATPEDVPVDAQGAPSPPRPGDLSLEVR
jgi:hypothetical protein